MPTLYKQLVHGDVYTNWKTVMRLANTEDANKKRVNVVNILLSLWLVGNAIRFGSMFFDPAPVPEFVVGHTLSHLGSWAKLIGMVGFLFINECAGLRLAMYYLTSTNSMILLDTVKQIGHERDGELRIRKLKMARKVLLSFLIAFTTMVLDRSMFYTSMFVKNVMSASSGLEGVCWILWWFADLTIPILIPLDLIIFPSMWVVVVLSHRMEIRHLIERIESLAEAPVHTRSAGFQSVMQQHTRLLLRSVAVNSFSAPILFVVTLFASPAFSAVMFTVEYSDSELRWLYIVAGAPILSGVVALLSTAASVTATSEELHSRLCSMACDARVTDSLTPVQKFRLLLMVEETGSESTQLAMYTVHGQKYTKENLLHYVIEVGLDYTLFLTFIRSYVTF